MAQDSSLDPRGQEGRRAGLSADRTGSKRVSRETLEATRASGGNWHVGRVEQRNERDMASGISLPADPRIASAGAHSRRPLWMGMLFAVFVVAAILLGMGLLNHGAGIAPPATRPIGLS